jgi:glycosyltransferase involved in cell wall biosynthesis
LTQAGIRERVVIVFGQPLAPALAANTTFVRPTRADGDAVSIREAISAGVPVVASDVVGRPPGVLTFPVGNSEELAAALQEVLQREVSSENRSPVAQSPASGSFADQLIVLYRSELARASTER